jgi:diguanylate cyclase (GGDEF)-like protein
VVNEEAAVGDVAAVAERRRVSSRRAIVLLAVALWSGASLLACAVFTAQHWSAPAAWSTWIALPALTVGFVLTETFVVHLRIRSDAHTFSLVELPIALGLFFVQPLALVAAQVVGAGLALLVHRRQNVLKVLFNTGVFAFTTVVAITIYRSVVPTNDGLHQRELLAGATALLFEALLSVVLVFVVISISAGSWRFKDLRSGVGFGIITALFTSSLGIIAVVVFDAQPEVAWLLVIPTAGTYLASWAYTTQRRRHEGLDFLYRSTQLLHQSSDLEAALAELLRHTCDTFNAGSAELVYITETDDRPVCVRVRPDDASTSPALLGGDLDHPALQAVLSDSEARIARYGDSPVTDQFLDLSGYATAIIAPLLGEHRVVGALVIGNRMSQVVGFDATDLRMAETLANHTTTALENGRLEQSLQQLRILEGRLTYQALHDPLTGLANRTLFRSSLSSMIADHDGSRGAVLFIDLDDFKTVNDTFGHAAGDAMLMEVATRLQSCVDEFDLVARFGGDEFAILLHSATEADAAFVVADRIQQRLQVPFTLVQRRMTIRASVGVAMIETGADPETVMRSADTAMYTAKAQGKHRSVMFESEMYESVLHRFNLNNDLQRAIDRNEMSVYFQPIVRLGSHELLGAEALIRWNHGALGLLTPEAFLPVAEQTGLITAIDMIVLDEACAWLSAVNGSDPDMVPWVNVNISPQSFQEPGLVEMVQRVLRRHRLTPSQLGIEVTENLMSEQADESIATLRRLRELGVRLALDDFGTGYSSLSHLQTLPIEVVKIAKQFVDELDTSETQRGLTSAIVALAQVLDKFVVAEGIERPEQLDVLESFGCDGGQGYYFARPMDEVGFLAWARAWTTPAPDAPTASLSAVPQRRRSERHPLDSMQ